MVGEWVEDFVTYAKMQWEDFDYKLPKGESLREVQSRNISALMIHDIHEIERMNRI